MREAIRRLLESLKCIIDSDLLLIVLKSAVTALIFIFILWGFKVTLVTAEKFLGPFWLVGYIELIHEGYLLIVFMVTCIFEMKNYIKKNKK